VKQGRTRGYKGYKDICTTKFLKFDLTTNADYAANFVNAVNMQQCSLSHKYAMPP